MKNTIVKAIAFAAILGFATVSFGAVEIVKDSAITSACHSVGLFEGNAGYGKSMDGTRVALYRAKKKAEKAGANTVVIKTLNRGTSGLGGYCVLKAYHCPVSF
ncbi:MAG: hypothetical protein RJB66_299 [Pseudomonadota bacterium]|jgi:hypothetical protein